MTVDGTLASDRRSRQKRVGDALRQDTRDRLLAAAGTEFAAHGYVGTTVARLAAAAGVSVQTLYLAWGSKRALLRGYMEQALAGGAASPDAAAGRFTPDMPPHLRLEVLADLVTEIAERAATGWTLYRDAAAIDPDIAADWDELQLLRHRLFAKILDGVPADALAAGLTAEAATDTAWAIASPETHDLLVNRLHHSLDDFAAWLRRVLPVVLLAEPSGR